MIFRKKKKNTETDAERDFKTILDIVKDYDKKGFNKLIDAIEDCWNGYDKILRTQTREEKANADLIEAEKTLELIEDDK